MCAEYFTGQPINAKDLILISNVIKDILNDNTLTLTYTGRVFPRSKAPILVFDDKLSVFKFVDSEFSLIPSWWKPDAKTFRPRFATHNARLDTLSQKPSFRSSLMHNHCIVPIDAFFESSVFGSQFAGHRIKISSHSMLFAAGLYSDWINPQTGEITSSFTIITSDPNQRIFEAGHDRMPVFLNYQGLKEWLLLNSKENSSHIQFLRTNQIHQMDFEIQIDRALKEGWQKNSPSPEELKELKLKILA